MNIRFKDRDAGKGRGLGKGRSLHPSVGPYLIKYPVHQHHFAVKPIKGADAEITVLQQRLQG